MNQTVFQNNLPFNAISRDAVQIQSFATATEQHFFHLNQYLGFSLDPWQYRKWQQHFYHTEKKNPTMGELRLLGHWINCLPQIRRIAPTELYTDSELIMETWADIMDGYAVLSQNSDTPCSIHQILTLPKAYLKNAGIFYESATKIVAASGVAECMTEGYEPISDVQLQDGTHRRILAHWEKPTSLPARIGDVLIVLPPAALSALTVLQKELLPQYPIRSYAFHQNGSLLATALTLCNGHGISIDLNTLVPPAPPQESRIEQYISLWETSADTDHAYTVVCLPSSIQALLFTSLAEHGFTPRLLGTVLKSPRVVMNDNGIATVNLSIQAFQNPEAALPCRVNLQPPTPIGALPHSKAMVHPPYQVPKTELTVCHTSATVTGQEGFAQAVQSILTLCCHMATVGILYDKLTISPTLYVNDRSDSPLLISCVCGLYRACTELGIPMIYPEVLYKSNQKADEPKSLTLAITASAEQIPVALSESLRFVDQPLSLLSIDEAPQWDDIRHMLYRVANSAHTGQSFVHYLGGQSVLSYLNRIAHPEVNITTRLFEEHRAEVASPHPFGFLVEGTCPAGALPIGVTIPREEGLSLAAPQANTTAAPLLTPMPTVTLKILKDKESQRRKETLAMEKIKAFEPLCKVPRTVLLDTDIGPDCDDVGALAVLIYYAKKYNFPIGGICNCTSNKAGNGVIDAICRRCGIDTPPLGQWHGEGFMDDQEYCKYNTAVAEAHSEAYRSGTLHVEDEVTYYRKRLASSKDGEVMVVSIGMFNNLASLLDSPADEISPLTGVELVKAKVYALVSMAAILPQGRECNVLCDYPAAEKVFSNWPTPIYLSDFHIGVNVKTGYGHITDPETIMTDPLPMSYHLYTQAWNWEGAVKGQNASYDLTAVQFAALGICDLYDLDTPGDLEFYAEIPDLPDATRFVENPMGNKIFMTKKVSDEVIAESLQEILNSF